MLLIPKISVGQPIPECTGSKVRYAATPDTNTVHPGFVSNYVWIFDNGVNGNPTIWGSGDSVDITWGKVPGAYKLGVIQSTDFGITGISSNCTGDTSWTNIQLNGYWAQILGSKEYNEGDIFNFNVALANTYDSIIWNNKLHNKVYSDTAKTTDTIFVDVYSNSGCHSSDTVIMVVHPLPKFDILYKGTIITDTLLCGADTITISAGKPDTSLRYKWSDGTTSRTMLVDALQADSPDSTRIYTVVVTNTYGGHSSKTFTLKRCPNYSITLTNIKNEFPKNGKYAGNAAKFEVVLINGQVLPAESLTIWYYVQNDILDTTAVTFGPGLQSGTFDVKTNNYNSYFTGNADKTKDVERTVVVSKARIGSRAIVQIQKSGIFYIMHKPTIKEIKYIP
jgi:hypothetical protein